MSDWLDNYQSFRSKLEPRQVAKQRQQQEQSHPFPNTNKPRHYLHYSEVASNPIGHSRRDHARPMKDGKEAYLIITNIQKDKNVMTMLRAARAFSIDQVCLIKQYNIPFETSPYIRELELTIHHFRTITHCQKYLQHRGVMIIGIEIMVDGTSLLSETSADIFASTPKVAFMLGNEGSGMNRSQLAICDRFMYIPQYGGGTASLNVAVAASIVMYQYYLWATSQGTSQGTSQDRIHSRTSGDLTTLRTSPHPGSTIIEDPTAMTRTRPNDHMTSTST